MGGFISFLLLVIVVAGLCKHLPSRIIWKILRIGFRVMVGLALLSLAIHFVVFIAKQPAPGMVMLLLFCGAIILFGKTMGRLFGPILRLVFPGPWPRNCPPIGRLKDLLAECLPCGEQAQLAAHLEICTACQHRVEGLTAGKRTWPGLARKLSQQKPFPEPALQEVVKRLKENYDERGPRHEPVFSDDLPLGFLSPPDKPDQLGRLERYEVLAEIGRGGMGVVLKAFDPSLHRVVAIKVLAPQLATSGVARKRFLREAKAAAAVTHDHIVTIYAVDESNGLPYLVMQYIPGLSLQERIDKDGPLELPEVLRIGMQTASGLTAAHSHGIVHRDIKPANILLEDGVQRVKITDFGLARAMDDASLTQSGFVAGSPLYMAPEQARGEALDYRADLFSLGSVLYTLCTGRPPFRAANTLAVLRRVSEETPRPIRETNPEVPDWLAAVVDKLMAKDPANRYQSAAEVEQVLGQHLAQLQGAAWVPPAPRPAPAAAKPGTAGLPTSMTLCPSCGTNLDVPERLVGSIVHCAECGKPFQVQEGSEVIEVARAVPAPLGPRFRGAKKPAPWLWVACGCAALLFLLVFFASSNVQFSAPSAPEAATVIQTFQQPNPEPFWKAPLGWFPAEATLFGALDLQAFGSLTLDDAWTQTVLRLVVPGEEREQLTPENLGRIRIDGVSLAYYQDPKTEKAHGLLQLDGVALDGRKRMVDFISRLTLDKAQIEQGGQRQLPWQPIRLSCPQMPFALGFFDDHKVVLARSMHRNATDSQHLQALAEIPFFDFADGPRPANTILSGYNPPWLRTALVEMPPDACGLALGEIPSEWRKLLTEALDLQVCPRTFVFSMKKEQGGVTLSLSLNVDKAGDELLLQKDLEKWRQKGLDVLQARFPGMRQERAALALVRKTLKTMRWGANPGSGCVRTVVQIPGATWKALRDLLQKT